MDVGEAKAAIAALLKRYEKFRNDPALLSNEKQACQSLIVPLIRTVLGWDVDDPSEFKVEEQLIGKRIDYVVCSEGISQFIVEAKAPTREIIKDAAAYQQALDYGHGKNHPFAILTNFRQFIVLDCFRKTRHPTEAEIARIDLTAANDTDIELLLLFERGYWLSSGTQNRLYALQHTKDRRATVDAELLEDMKTWREQLLRSLRKHETRIEWDDPQKVDQAEEEVQRMIDRLVFIAFCEDKGLKEPRLWELLEAKNGKFSMSPGWLWGKIRELYAQYDKDYDSSLFKKSRCDDFSLDDAAILTVLQDLRAPPGRSAYNFASIEVDILGRVYENFIGHIQTGKKRFTEKEDKGKRKKEGIYYTPKYIVDYIVNNTVRVAARGKSFEDILKLKIVDPACGSGSFLLGAFGVLCEEAARSLGKKKGEDLSEDEKKRIMTSCIHGVDLDRRAVQIAELSLALRLAGRSRLPELSHNIRHGNSLIDDKDVAGYDAFDWKSEFPDVFKQGGFDVVVGNPPYIKEYVNREVFEPIKKTKMGKYYQGKMDFWYFFTCLAIDILKEGGLHSFIAPNNWVTNAGASILRNKVIDETEIHTIVDFNDFKVFKDASIQTAVFVIQKQTPRKEYAFSSHKVLDKSIPQEDLAKYLLSRTPSTIIEQNKFMIRPSELRNGTLTFSGKEAQEVLDKINTTSNYRLRSEDVGQGIVTPQDNVLDSHLEVLKDEEIKKGDGIFVLRLEEVQKLKLNAEEKLLVRPYYTTNQLQRYWGNPQNELWILYMDGVAKNNIKQYPSIKAHLDRFKKVITSDFAPYGLHRARAQHLFEGEKIISLRKTRSPYFTHTEFPCYVSQTYYIIQPKDVSMKYLTGLLNSNLIFFWLKSKGKMQGDQLQIDKAPLLEMPLYAPKDKKEIGIQNQISSLVDSNLNLYKKRSKVDKNSEEAGKIETEIEKTDKEINNLVYDLYDLTAEERRIIEGS